MANNLIQIKRSQNTAVPSSLANGELAYTANGDILFIGSSSAVVPIAGKRFPGTLTANQALVANSTSGIDKVIVANLVPSVVWANGASGTASQVLTSNSTGGVYWNTPLPSVAGSNTEIQFNDEGALGTNASFTFNKSSSTLTVGNSTVNTTVTPNSLNVNSAVIANQSGLFATGVVNASTVQVGSSFRANSTQFTIGSSVGFVANGSLGTANQVLRTSGSGIYWDDDVGDISAITAGNGLTGGGTSGDISLSVVAGDGLVVNATGVHIVGANGINVGSDIVGLTTGSTLTVNTTGAHVNTNLSITSLTTSGDTTVNGNTTLGNSNSDVVSFLAVVNTSIMPAANITYNLGNNTVRWNEVHVSNVHSVTGYFDGNLEVAGDLIVTGNVTTVNVASVVVSDPMIYLAGNNYSSDLVDIGFAANYNDGATDRHTGFFRDATDGVWKLFANSVQELSGNNTVNTTATGYTTAILQAYLTSGGLVTNATHVAITANSTVDVSITANSLTLSSPLATTSGGTGLATYSVGDLLVGNSSNALTKLAVGSDGYVLQINGAGVVAWNTLDGGTF